MVCAWPPSTPSSAPACSPHCWPPTVRRHPSRSAAPLPPWTAPSTTTSPTPASEPQHETCHNVTTSSPQERLARGGLAQPALHEGDAALDLGAGAPHRPGDDVVA